MDLDTRITLLGFKAFNFLYDISAFVGSTLRQGISDFSAYMAGRYNIWHFLEGDVGPLPDSVVHNRSIANIKWTYDVSSYKLTHNHTIGLQVTSEHPWLTAAIRIGNIEYDMDNFIRHFKWISTTNIYPSKKLILNAWSIHSGIWLSNNDNPIMRVITHDGDQVDISIFDNDNTSWHRLLIGGTNSETDSSEVESSSDESSSDESSYEESSSDGSSYEESSSEESSSDESGSENETNSSTNSTSNAQIDRLTISDNNDISNTMIFNDLININPSPILQATSTNHSRIESDNLELIS